VLLPTPVPQGWCTLDIGADRSSQVTHESAMPISSRTLAPFVNVIGSNTQPRWRCAPAAKSSKCHLKKRWLTFFHKPYHLLVSQYNSILYLCFVLIYQPKTRLIMKARLLMAALAFVALSSMAVAQEPAKAGCCQPKTECCQGKEAAKAGDKSTKKETAKKADTKKVAKATSKKAA